MRSRTRPGGGIRLGVIDPTTANTVDLRAVAPTTKADLMANWNSMVCRTGLTLRQSEAAVAAGEVALGDDLVAIGVVG